MIVPLALDDLKLRDHVSFLGTYCTAFESPVEFLKHSGWWTPGVEIERVRQTSRSRGIGSCDYRNRASGRPHEASIPLDLIPKLRDGCSLSRS